MLPQALWLGSFCLNSTPSQVMTVAKLFAVEPGRYLPGILLRQPTLSQDFISFGNLHPATLESRASIWF